ncbi:PREDICTED: peptidyl-prolyl cis-trans isomerase FKBP53-like [Camelina sativa]|uniref:FK506-binding protein n=1 Tax=Camelina sativa TaxID=90675 RepID=A0ABM0UBX3_CAMSA|nr:PREDICTED: peptidyl-prolyl cis-trans isomerase FKBP53-like [Camelina sativa]
MGFWGLEVKPGKPQPYNPKNEQGKIHVTQATLGSGFAKEKSVIQCSIGDKAPVFLCSLLPNKIECCPLNLEFDDDDEPIEFSVTGDRSIYLSGFLEYYDEDEDQDDYEEDEDDGSDGVEIGESESDYSCEYDSEEDQLDKFEDFLDTSLEMYRNASAPKSGVVIEEIEDEEKPAKDSKTKRTKKSQASEAENAKKQIVPVESAHVPVLESEDEDEDGLPIPKGEASEPENKSGEKMDLDNEEQGSNKKRKAKAPEQDGGLESGNKSKKKKNQKEKKKEENASEADEQVQTGNVLKKQETSQVSQGESSQTPTKSAEKKNKKKKKNSSQEATTENNTISSSAEKQTQVDSKSSQVRTHPNGLKIEELSMGKPNGKRADPGKQVFVRYIGKLQKNGKIFDSNIGKSPFKFRLGVGQVIKGWDVGVNGMRVGDKRRLTIPPSMGYGTKGSAPQIPPNAWLSFEVELVNVQ